jgi:hypothetical protein
LSLKCADVVSSVSFSMAVWSLETRRKSRV